MNIVGLTMVSNRSGKILRKLLNPHPVIVSKIRFTLFNKLFDDNNRTKIKYYGIANYQDIEAVPSETIVLIGGTRLNTSCI